MTLVIPTPSLARGLLDWAPTQPRLSYFGGRFYAGFPADVVYPAARVYKSGGGRVDSGGDLPIWEINIAWDLWHNDPNQFEPLEDAAGELEALVEYLTTGSGPQQLPHGVLVTDCKVNTSLPSPDPASDWPRFILDTTFWCVPNDD